MIHALGIYMQVMNKLGGVIGFTYIGGILYLSNFTCLTRSHLYIHSLTLPERKKCSI